MRRFKQLLLRGGVIERRDMAVLVMWSHEKVNVDTHTQTHTHTHTHTHRHTHTHTYTFAVVKAVMET